jgi:hypothetical protein
VRELVVRAIAVIAGLAGAAGGARTLGGLFTLLVQRQREGWRIVHDHTSARP